MSGQFYIGLGIGVLLGAIAFVALTAGMAWWIERRWSNGSRDRKRGKTEIGI